MIFSTGKSLDVSVDSKDSRIEEDKSVRDQIGFENRGGVSPRQREFEMLKEESIINETEKMSTSPPAVIELKVDLEFKYLENNIF